MRNRTPVQACIDRLFAAMPVPLGPDLRGDRADMGQIRDYRPGDVVLPAGEPPPFAGAVASGFLRLKKSLGAGKRQIVGLLVEGDLFGHACGGPVGFAIEAATDARVCTFPRPQFDALLARSEALERLLLLNTLEELDRAREWMVILTRPQIVSRLAGFLLVLCTHFPDTGQTASARHGGLELTVPITRTDLARLLGTRVETVSRAYRALAEDGVVILRSPQRIEIRDLTRLAALAGEEDLVSNGVPEPRALGRI